MYTIEDFSHDELAEAAAAAPYAICFFCDHAIAEADDATTIEINCESRKLCPTCAAQEALETAEEEAAWAYLASCQGPAFANLRKPVMKAFNTTETEAAALALAHTGTEEAPY